MLNAIRAFIKALVDAFKNAHGIPAPVVKPPVVTGPSGPIATVTGPSGPAQVDALVPLCVQLIVSTRIINDKAAGPNAARIAVDNALSANLGITDELIKRGLIPATPPPSPTI